VYRQRALAVSLRPLCTGMGGRDAKAQVQSTIP
jgi:hypothetical protein